MKKQGNGTKKQKVGFQLTPKAIEVLEEAKWVLRKSKNRVLEELILKHLKPSHCKQRSTGEIVANKINP